MDGRGVGGPVALSDRQHRVGALPVLLYETRRGDGLRGTRARRVPHEAHAPRRVRRHRAHRDGDERQPVVGTEDSRPGGAFGRQPALLARAPRRGERGRGPRLAPGLGGSCHRARIDRLSTADRHFLRRVSVLGRSAPRQLLEAVLETVPDPADDSGNGWRTSSHPTRRAISSFAMRCCVTAPTTGCPTGCAASCTDWWPIRSSWPPELSPKNGQSPCRCTTSMPSDSRRHGGTR